MSEWKQRRFWKAAEVVETPEGFTVELVQLHPGDLIQLVYQWVSSVYGIRASCTMQFNTMQFKMMHLKMQGKATRVAGKPNLEPTISSIATGSHAPAWEPTTDLEVWVDNMVER